MLGSAPYPRSLLTTPSTCPCFEGCGGRQYSGQSRLHSRMSRVSVQGLGFSFSDEQMYV